MILVNTNGFQQMAYETLPARSVIMEFISCIPGSCEEAVILNQNGTVVINRAALERMGALYPIPTPGDIDQFSELDSMIAIMRALADHPSLVAFTDGDKP